LATGTKLKFQKWTIWKV